MSCARRHREGEHTGFLRVLNASVEVACDFFAKSRGSPGPWTEEAWRKYRWDCPVSGVLYWHTNDDEFFLEKNASELGWTRYVDSHGFWWCSTIGKRWFRERFGAYEKPMSVLER